MSPLGEGGRPRFVRHHGSSEPFFFGSSARWACGVLAPAALRLLAAGGPSPTRPASGYRRGPTGARGCASYSAAVKADRGWGLTIDHILLRVVQSQWNAAVAIPLAMLRVRDSRGATPTSQAFRCV